MWRGTPPNEHTAAWGAHACGAEFHHNDDRGGGDRGDGDDGGDDGDDGGDGGGDSGDGGDDDDGGDGESILISEYIWLTADDEQDKDVEKSCNVEHQRM